MTPVRYWQMHESDSPIADLLNSTNFVFWQPGPDRHTPKAPPKGWRRVVKRPGKSLAVLPHANRGLIRGPGVKIFLQRRALQLPRAGGFFLIRVKVCPPVTGQPFYGFSMGLAHYRHQGPSAPFAEFDSQEELPEMVRKWFPTELGE